MKKEILLVDDEEKIRKTTSEALRSEGFIVKTAKSIETARDTLQEWIPDLLLLDILLPSGDLKKFVKNLDTFEDLKIIYLSAFPQAKAESFGFLNASKKVMDYVEKPYSLSDLLQTINNALPNR